MNLLDRFADFFVEHSVAFILAGTALFLGLIVLVFVGVWFHGIGWVATVLDDNFSQLVAKIDARRRMRVSGAVV